MPDCGVDIGVGKAIRDYTLAEPLEGHRRSRLFTGSGTTRKSAQSRVSEVVWLIFQPRRTRHSTGSDGSADVFFTWVYRMTEEVIGANLWSRIYYQTCWGMASSRAFRAISRNYTLKTRDCSHGRRKQIVGLTSIDRHQQERDGHIIIL